MRFRLSSILRCSAPETYSPPEEAVELHSAPPSPVRSDSIAHQDEASTSSYNQVATNLEHEANYDFSRTLGTTHALRNLAHAQDFVEHVRQYPPEASFPAMDMAISNIHRTLLLERPAAFRLLLAELPRYTDRQRERLVSTTIGSFLASHGDPEDATNEFLDSMFALIDALPHEYRTSSLEAMIKEFPNVHAYRRVDAFLGVLDASQGTQARRGIKTMLKHNMGWFQSKDVPALRQALETP